ncbi:MAG: hypothetical protein OXK16_07235 [bacterium]|nr:hypothetical protein [bacterium]
MNVLGAWRFDARNVADALDAVGRLWGEEDHLLEIDTLTGVIEELMVNAVEHSGGGGVVTLLRIGATVTLRVKESGVGIHHNMAAASEEISVARAFQPGPEGTSSGSGFRGEGLVLAFAGPTQIPGLTLYLQSGATSYVAANGVGYVNGGSGDFHQGVLVELIVDT